MSSPGPSPGPSSSSAEFLEASMKYTPYKKRVLITGGTKGIGRAVVEEFSRLGANVFTCARNAEELAALLEECKSKNWNVQGVVADVAESEGRLSLVAAVSAAFDHQLDVLINNVGTNVRKKTTEFTDQDAEHLNRTNLLSAFCLTRDCHALLKKTGDACVLFNSSVAGGPTAMKSGSLYALSKASLNQLAKNLTCEWAHEGIRVISVAPWYTATPLAMQVLSDRSYEAEVLSRTPMRRVAEPVEVARVMAFLASPAASYVTGATIPVDGGYSCMGLF